MKKERLTKEEQDLLLKFKNDRIGLVCGDENRELAESSISQFYDLICRLCVQLLLYQVH